MNVGIFKICKMENSLKDLNAKNTIQNELSLSLNEQSIKKITKYWIILKSTV